MKRLLKKIFPNFILSYYYLMWPFSGSVIYRRPSRKLKVIGITGTNGKTTVTHLATQLLEESGYKVASISSLRFKIREREWENKLKMTMPGRMQIQQFLRRAADEGCEYVIMEVTSEGIKQKRHKFINFDTVVFTNLTPEHIESHGSFDKYREAKGELFALPHRTSIVNLDDPSAGYFLHFEAREKVGYTVEKKENIKNVIRTIGARDVLLGSDGISFQIQNSEFKLPLLGKFNVSNALAALSVGLAQGLESREMARVFPHLQGVPGRMEVVVREPFTVVVDYAHTPDALQKVYKTLTTSYKLQATSSHMVCVLGSAGGGRDKWKRPQLGKIAAQYCDEIILTNEDPYDENPETILKEIEGGIKTYNLKPITYNPVLDRRTAVHEALKLAKAGDTVIITGKGAEPWLMAAHGEKIPWDDRAVVREEFKKIYEK